MTLDELLAREAIRDLVVRYNSNGDTGRFEQLWVLFADDAVMEVGPAHGERTTYSGLEQVKLIFTGAQQRVRDRAEQVRPTYIRHLTATHQIDLVDADHASGRCYFAVIVGDVGGEGGMKQAAFEAYALGERRLIGAVDAFLGHHHRRQ